MKNLKKQILLIAAITFAVVLNFINPKKAYADGGPTVSCSTSTQICYKVYLFGVLTSTVKGVAEIRL